MKRATLTASQSAKDLQAFQQQDVSTVSRCIHQGLRFTSRYAAKHETTRGSTQHEKSICFNAYGSTQSIGSRTCVMVGPKGQNVDVVAHELMHAEIHHRVGYLAYFFQIPTWFNEGVAMQVDYRARYSLSPQDSQNTAYVRDLTASSNFYESDDQALTRNYASAKHEVASWLTKVGTTTLYSRLQRMRDGQSFAEATTE